MFSWTCIRTAVPLGSTKTSKWPVPRVGRAHLKSAGGGSAVANEGVAYRKPRVDGRCAAADVATIPRSRATACSSRGAVRAVLSSRASVDCCQRKDQDAAHQEQRRAAGHTMPGHGRVADIFDAAIELGILSIPVFPARRLAGEGEIHPQRSAVKRQKQIALLPVSGLT